MEGNVAAGVSMDDTRTFIDLAKVGGPLLAGMVFAIRVLIKRLSHTMRELRNEMKDSNDKCEARNSLLHNELKDLRDNTIKSNTEALRSASHAIDRFVERYGSGTHPIKKDDSHAH